MSDRRIGGTKVWYSEKRPNCLEIDDDINLGDLVDWLNVNGILPHQVTLDGTQDPYLPVRISW